MWRRPFPWFIVAAALLYAFYPYFADDVGLRESLLLAAVYIILASNLNLMIGYAGYVSAECLPWPNSDEAARLTIEAYRTHFSGIGG